MSVADWIAVGSAVINLGIFYVAALVNTKISKLKVDMYETFLTKDDYFEFQRRRDFRTVNNPRRK